MANDNSTFEANTENPAGTDNAAGTSNAAGTFQPPPPAFRANTPKRLYRTDGPISGVSAGLAEYSGVDAILIRLAIVALSIVAFPAMPIVYLAAWIIIPRADVTPVPPIMAPNPVAQQNVTPAAVHPDAPAPSSDSLSAR